MPFYILGSFTGGIIAGLIAPIHTKIMIKSKELADVNGSIES